ncbi:hypothetical protein [Paracoccus sp. 22332]|uniref:hypothetical protein n=1 Tax=Paracoccus sp. 22332 TaxID=3453913 RepID=UPI003F85651A
MALDEKLLRAAGLPTSLISLLVSITKAAERAMAAANTASVANGLEPQIAAAMQVLNDLQVAPRLAEITDRLVVVEGKAATIPAAYDDTDVKARLEAVEGAPRLISLINRDGALVALLSDGTEIIGPEFGEDAEPIDPPTVIGSIADRIYTIDQSVPATDLRTKFENATSYVINPSIAQAVINGYNLEFSTFATLAETTFFVRGVNAGGQSDPVTFRLRINAQAPILNSPLPDRSLVVSDANIMILLDDYFSGAASYSISPTGQGGSISGRSLLLSAATERSLEMTITATNSTGQTVSDTFLFVVAQPQPTLQATITPDPLVAGQPFTVNFNAAPDEVTSSVTLTGTGTTRTGTAPASGIVTIGATKAGYTAYSATFEVAPAVPSAAKTADNKVILSGVTPQSDPFGFGIGQHPTYGGAAVTVANPADLGDGPVCLIAPVISAAGSVLTALPGLWGSLHSTATILGEWYRGGVETDATSLTYNVGPADDGAVMTYREIATDAEGASDPVPSNGITVSAPQPASYTSAGTGSVYNTASQTQHTIAAVPLGAASADRYIELDLNAYLITDGTAVITGVSIGGVAATQRAAQANGNEPRLRTGLWRAAVPSGTTGDVVITLDKPSALIAGCHAFRAIRMISGTPTFGNISPGAGAVLSTTVATAPGDRIIFTIGSNGGAASGGWWGSPVGHTEVVDFAGAPSKGDAVRTNLYIGVATVAPGDTSPRTLSVTSQGAVLTRATHIVRKVTEIV